MAGLVAILCMDPCRRTPSITASPTSARSWAPPFLERRVEPSVRDRGRGRLHLLFIWNGAVFHETLGARRRGILLAAVFLVGFGSAYYHGAPTTSTPLLGPVPRTLMFSAFLAITVGERMRPAWGARLLVPLLAAGLGTLLYCARASCAGRATSGATASSRASP